MSSFFYKIEFSSGREVEFEVEYSMTDGGIGAYEFWGARYYDTHPELDEISFIPLEDLTEEEKKELEKIQEDIPSDLLDKIYDHYREDAY